MDITVRLDAAIPALRSLSGPPGVSEVKKALYPDIAWQKRRLPDLRPDSLRLDQPSSTDELVGREAFQRRRHAPGNIWHLTSDNRLANRVITCHGSIFGNCRRAWHDLVEQPWNVMSIGLRNSPMRYDQPVSG